MTIIAYMTSSNSIMVADGYGYASTGMGKPSTGMGKPVVYSLKSIQYINQTHVPTHIHTLVCALLTLQSFAYLDTSIQQPLKTNINL